MQVPGSYRAGEEVVKIARFVSSVRVLSSKQRPRRITIVGSDGKHYKFLLKGHEDLRQDERVMQLFGLVNTLLSNNMQTARAGLSIQQFVLSSLVVFNSPRKSKYFTFARADALCTLADDCCYVLAEYAGMM